MTSTTTAAQVTTEGTQVVTVARDGTKLANFANGRYAAAVYTSAVYRAVRRTDGVLTWRRSGSYAADSTAGRGVTGPMAQRARERAKELGCEYYPGIRHGQVCK